MILITSLFPVPPKTTKSHFGRETGSLSVLMLLLPWCTELNTSCKLPVPPGESATPFYTHACAYCKTAPTHAPDIDMMTHHTFLCAHGVYTEYTLLTITCFSKSPRHTLDFHNYLITSCCRLYQLSTYNFHYDHSYGAFTRRDACLWIIAHG